MTCSRPTRPCATRTRSSRSTRARRSRSCTSTTGIRAARARTPTRRCSRSAPTVVRPLREGQAGEGAARRRGADPDLPAAAPRPAGPTALEDLGRAQPRRGALRRRRRPHGALHLRQPGGLARDRPDRRRGRLRLHAGRRRGRARPPTVCRAATGSGYTLLGSPVLSARFAVTGRDPALAARLWDVAPGGATQTLVARALYRPRPGKRQVFQLHPNGWRFAAGHVPKLELVGTRLPLRPPVELRLVDQGLGPEVPPTGARQAGRRGEEAEAPVQALAGAANLRLERQSSVARVQEHASLPASTARLGFRALRGAGRI